MSMEAKSEADLRVLLDKQEIHEVMMRYCRAVDRVDEELLRSVYHPDAVDNHGLFNGKASDFVPWCIRQLREAYTATQHFIGNELIEVQGDQAWCEFYFVAYHRYERKGEPRHMSAVAVMSTASSGATVSGVSRSGRSWSIGSALTRCMNPTPAC
jgi:SnoaL-like domain